MNEIEGSSTLDTSEIDEMIENAEKFAASDKESRSNKSPGFRKRLKASVTKLRGRLSKYQTAFLKIIRIIR